jgi:quinol monooxygenase YgiN
MADSEVIILVELDVLSEFTEAVISRLQSSHPIALQHPGCDLFLQTSVEEDRSRVRLIEVFATHSAHQSFVALDSTKEVFGFLQGKLSAPPRVTKLRGL